MKKLLLIIFACTISIYSQPEFSSISSKAGSFSRIGFGPRGIGFGNAMSAVTEGNLVSYYNPAVSVFQEGNSFQTGYTFLSLDRSLNFLNFTKRFDFYSAKDSANPERKPSSTAGVSFGLINAGVSGIDGRDNNGLKTEELSTSENQFFLGVANRFSEKFSIGIAVKFYYYSLYEEISSTGLGFDLGALYRLNDNFNFAVVISDLNSKYKWDTSPVYETEGLITEDKFPLLKKIGVRYKSSSKNLLVGVEFESSNSQTNFIRVGAEYNIYEGLYLRGGIDQYNLSNPDMPAKPSVGFSYLRAFESIVVGVDYAFMIEQYSPNDRHIIGININF